jgi:hypothetical protein
MWWSADETRFLHRNPMGTGFSDFLAVIDVASGTVTHNGIPIGSLPGDEGFDPVDPNAVYYHSGSTIHKVTLTAGSWSDAVYFTAPGGATIQSLGGTMNWLDASGRYMVVRYGPEPSVHVFDRSNLAAGPYANAADGASTIGRGSYVGISPDGQYLVGYQGADGSAGLYRMGQGVSWKINHATRSITATPTAFWSVCGDHGSFISTSDGRNYMVVSACTAYSELWRVDITNSIGGLDEAGQKALPNNRRLMAWPTWNEVGAHVTTVAKGALRDWAFYATEDGSDALNGPVTPWHAYRQEIIAFNVLTGEVRRLAHHRSRLAGDYYAQPRLSTSWGGKYVGWASNFNQSGVVDIFAVPFSPTTIDTIPPTISMTSPASGSTVSGPTTVSATASDNVGVVGVQFKLDGANLGAEMVTSPYTGTWDPSTTANGIHTLTGVARDAAGNTKTSGSVTVTVNIVADTTPPVISGVAASAVSASGATIIWTTNESSTSQADYGRTTGYGSATALNATLLTAHSQSVSGLSPSTVYHYRVKSRDAAGNLATSGDFAFTTSAPSPPIAYWPLDDGSGTVALDATGNGNAGTLVNGPTWGSGAIAGALTFNGVNQSVTVAHTPALDAFPLTVSAWIKTTSTTGVSGIVNKYVANSNNGYNLFLNNGALCAWYFRTGTNHVYDGGGCTLQTTGYNNGLWHLVTYVVDLTGATLYVDGAPVRSLAWTGPAGPPTTTQPVHVGHYPGAFGGVEYFPGSIDDVRLYNRALSAAEISALYRAVVP